MRHKIKKRFASIFILGGIFLCAVTPALGGWEAGAKAGFDTNVNRAVNDGKSDGFVSGYLSYFRGPSGESRVDWTMGATLEGTGFARLNDLDFVQLTLAPGLTFFPYLNWTISVAPFVQGKAVKDSDQTAFAFGGKLNLRQQINKLLYTGQYYMYKDSRANADTYSYRENAVGAYAGLNWTRSFFSEIGYEFSSGDSFRTVSTATAVSSGRGRNRRFSTAFGEDVVREKINRHSIGVNAGLDWTKSLFSFASYYFTIMEGDLGTSTAHTGYLGIGYRF